MPIISIMFTIIATILIVPSDSDWVFNLSGGSRTASLVLLGIFWTIDIIWLFGWSLNRMGTKTNALDNSIEQKEKELIFENKTYEEKWNEFSKKYKRYTKDELISIAVKIHNIVSIHEDYDSLSKMTKFNIVKLLWICRDDIPS